MELTLQQISAMLDDSYIYVDVRSEIAYQHGHIANAVHWNGIDNITFPENKSGKYGCDGYSASGLQK
mgnify:CR=1 FL=1